MALPNARNQYLKTQIETASKEQLVIMLFDGIIRFTEQARKAIVEQNLEDSHHALMRAQAIIMELICTVDKEKGGDVANNLMSLHAYAFNCLIVCNMKKDVTKIDEVQKIYRELRDAWLGAMDTLGISSSAGKPVAAAPAPAATPAPQAAARPAGQPLKPAAPAPVTTIGKPVAPGGGIMAKGLSVPAAGVKPPVVSPGAKLVAGSTQIASPAAQAPAAPVAPKATGYGMGRTAMLGAAMPSPVASPTPPVVPPQATTVTPNSAKQNAMLNAYSAGNRSIA